MNPSQFADKSGLSISADIGAQYHVNASQAPDL